MVGDSTRMILVRPLLTDGVRDFQTGPLDPRRCPRMSGPDCMLRGRSCALRMLRGETKDLRCRGFAQLGDITPPTRVRRGCRRFTS